MLRLNKSLSAEDRVNRVDSVLSDVIFIKIIFLRFFFKLKIDIQLNLKKCENTYIGNPERGLKGISNGEKRRLAVATEVNIIIKINYIQFNFNSTIVANKCKLIDGR